MSTDKSMATHGKHLNGNEYQKKTSLEKTWEVSYSTPQGARKEDKKKDININSPSQIRW
jgi:hypothetical protein